MFLCMFMTTVIKRHSLRYVIFNEKMRLFEMSLWARVRGKGRVRVRSNNVIFAQKMTKLSELHLITVVINMHKNVHIHDMCHDVSLMHTPSSKVLP